MRVLTSNVQHDAGEPRRTALLNRELRKVAPDLIALPEVHYPGQFTELPTGTGLAFATHQDRRAAPTADAPHRVIGVTEPRDGASHWWTLPVECAGCPRDQPVDGVWSSDHAGVVVELGEPG